MQCVPTSATSQERSLEKKKKKKKTDRRLKAERHQEVGPGAHIQCRAIDFMCLHQFSATEKPRAEQMGVKYKEVKKKEKSIKNLLFRCSPGLKSSR